MSNCVVEKSGHPVDSVRQRIMKSVRSRNTRPELAVRRFLHGAGLRYRLHDRSLPGSPDLVFRTYRAVVFVHGCFWHRHPGCSRATTLKTRTDFWRAKFDANVVRDQAAIAALEEQGWRVLVVWECSTRSAIDLARVLSPLFGLRSRVPQRNRAELRSRPSTP